MARFGRGYPIYNQTYHLRGPWDLSESLTFILEDPDVGPLAGPMTGVLGSPDYYEESESGTDATATGARVSASGVVRVPVTTVTSEPPIGIPTRVVAQGIVRVPIITGTLDSPIGGWQEGVIKNPIRQWPWVKMHPFKDKIYEPGTDFTPMFDGSWRFSFSLRDTIILRSELSISQDRDAERKP